MLVYYCKLIFYSFSLTEGWVKTILCGNQLDAIVPSILFSNNKICLKCGSVLLVGWKKKDAATFEGVWNRALKNNEVELGHFVAVSWPADFKRAIHCENDISDNPLFELLAPAGNGWNYEQNNVINGRTNSLSNSTIVIKLSK